MQTKVDGECRLGKLNDRGEKRKKRDTETES